MFTIRFTHTHTHIPDTYLVQTIRSETAIAMGVHARMHEQAHTHTYTHSYTYSALILI